MKLDQLISGIREQEPPQHESEAAAARVRERLFPPAQAPSGAIRSCADFMSLAPASLAGTLDASRKMLLDVHLRECVNCRKAMEQARAGSRNVMPFPVRRRSAAVPYAGWAAAAAAVLVVAGGTGYWMLQRSPSAGDGPRVVVDSISGELFKVAGAAFTPLASGAALRENDIVRTAKNSTAVLRLSDGSKIELNQRAEISVTRDGGGSTIHLAQGNIIVEAAKQRTGALRVTTIDCNVSVKGTVFSVDAGTKGSRVAVVEGTVWVDHGEKHDVLHRGDTTSTGTAMSAVPIREQIEWSRNSAQYLAILGDLQEIRRQISQLPTQNLRYESKLLAWLPGDVVALAAVPNIGGTVGQANRIFHERLNQSESLREWWNKMPVAQRGGFDATVARLETASAYLGNEIVIAALTNAAGQPAPLIVAEITRGGLDDYLRQQLPAKLYPNMRFDNGLFAAASDPADLARIAPSGNFLRTALYARLAPSYQQGAGWLFAADLSRIAHDNPAGARYLIAESRTMGRDTQNRASVIFNETRDGIASWLAPPAPMGSLDFISPDAAFSVSMLLKAPSAILPEMRRLMPGTELNPELLSEWAGAFGGEFTAALDGPLLPFPSWKIAAEVYYPDRLQSSLTKLAAQNPELHLTQSEEGGSTFYRLTSDKLPWEADWTFADGYWVAAANRELLIRSVQNRQSGFTLQKSAAFRNQLPKDALTNYSAVVFHNLGQTFAPLAGIIDTPLKNDTAGVICFWAKSDRIDVATNGLLSLDSLLSLKTLTPGDLIGQSFPQLRQGGQRTRGHRE